jgi:hypothetical protein
LSDLTDDLYDERQLEAARLIDSAFEGQEAPTWKGEGTTMRLYLDAAGLFDEVANPRRETIDNYTYRLFSRRVAEQRRVLQRRLASTYADALLPMRTLLTRIAEHDVPSPPLATRPSLERFVDELNDPQWEFRTIEGLADELGTTPDVVEELTEAYPELVRWLPAHDEDGRQLLVASRRRATAKERYLRFRAYVSKTY